MLELWTVYDHPSDYPDVFVARCFILDKPTDRVLTDKLLTNLRNQLPAGLYRLPRRPGDDPCIIESWV